MTSKEFYQNVFAQCEDIQGVQEMFKRLMNELCNASCERQEELKSGKKTAKTAKIEPKAAVKETAKAKVKKETAKAKKTTKSEAPEVEVIKINKRTISKLGLQYVDYSDKSFAIIGDTKPIKENLKTLKGRYNSRLTVNGEQVAGWVFAKRNAEPVKKSLYIA